MDFVSYAIEGSDFKAAGAASRAIKEHLKRIGADAEAIRRTMIAAYEAEMNVVIHADRGRLEASLSDRAVNVNVIDEGPGIPDIRRAMKEGFSTATSEARALGFGAGMGLPNIQRNSDRLRVSSRVGEGTRVSFTVMLKPAATSGGQLISLYASAERCIDCHRCLSACPTGAMRVRKGRPSVLEHLCIDCTCCIAACGPHALTLEDDVDALEHVERPADAVLALPPALLAGFGEHAGVPRVLAELGRLGFASLTGVQPYEDALRAAVLEHADAAEAARPVISPVCPAVMQLVELRFPSLLPHVAPFESPWEALQADAGGQRLACVVSCPSQRSALLAAAAQGGAEVVDLPTPGLVRRAVLPALAVGHDQAAVAGAAGTETPADGVLHVSGVAHVLAVLEQIENGQLTGVSVVEPFICDSGCFGSPLLDEDPHVALYRWARADGARAAGSGRAVRRRRPRTARPGIRLDADMAKAIEKLSRLDEITRSLPGKDCGACGAPICAALAEDIVMERAERSLCPYVEQPEVATP
jgi:anti-sigma regulatory factor (Ser/Thr protein kinase)/Na+-translocating ferredoxin:NAD+ oxidoreductase RNF subunit RnfB